MNWTDIQGYEGRYQISDEGLVRSLDFKDSIGRTRKGRVLKPSISRSGYLNVRISINDLKKSFSIHRLVALAFIENVDNSPQVNHIDGVKTNNSCSNLEWCNNSHNQKHAIEQGLIKIKTGKGAKAFKRSVNVIDSDDNVVIILSGSKEMISHGFDPRNVSACLNGKRKTYKGYRYEARI